MSMIPLTKRDSYLTWENKGSSTSMPGEIQAPPRREGRAHTPVIIDLHPIGTITPISIRLADLARLLNKTYHPSLTWSSNQVDILWATKLIRHSKSRTPEWALGAKGLTEAIATTSSSCTVSHSRFNTRPSLEKIFLLLEIFLNLAQTKISLMVLSGPRVMFGFQKSQLSLRHHISHTNTCWQEMTSR